MRWLYLAVICVLALATLVFAIENMEIVSIDFLWFSMRLPLALLAVIIYVTGMATGGSFLALIRRSMKGAGLVADTAAR
jgi:lipopolysaccharide assembly protein A